MSGEKPIDWVQNLKHGADLGAAVVSTACEVIDEMAKGHPKSFSEPLLSKIKDSFRTVPTNISHTKESKIEHAFGKTGEIGLEDLGLGMAIALTRRLAEVSAISEVNQSLLIFEFVATLNRRFIENEQRGQKWPGDFPG